VNGAETLVRTAAAGGIEVCFANAGTTEIPIIMAMDRVPGIKAILGLFEGVCTGAADGYARMLDRPAMALLHCGPGFANGVANLHNARRAQSPVFCVVGQHATWHRFADPPLNMDLEGLVRTVSGWHRSSRSPDAILRDVTEGIVASRFGQVASLIVPHDLQLAEAVETPATTPFAFDPPDGQTIELAARILRTAGKAALILDGRALRTRALRAAARIRAATGCHLFAPSFASCMDRGAGLPEVVRIPYFPEPAIEMLSGYDVVVLVSAHEPVTFFGYPGLPGFVLREDQTKLNLCTARQHSVDALEALADVLGAPSEIHVADRPFDVQPPDGELTPETACAVVAALQPEGAIIVDEGLTSALAYSGLTAGAPPHTHTMVTGGAIGYGMPCATGAAIACPERPVINLQADGSAMYTVQALWTQAREGLNVTTLVCSNRGYRIVRMELARAGIEDRGPSMRSLTEMDSPAVDWVSLSRGFGVPAVSVANARDMARELGRALAEPGPHLIELVLP
jgi:acetolactate synthase-1/2/3 large subunit